MRNGIAIDASASTLIAADMQGDTYTITVGEKRLGTIEELITTLKSYTSWT